MLSRPLFTDFLETLRRADFYVTIPDRIALSRLFEADTAWDLPLLEQRMASVVAHTAEEQARFCELFRAYFVPNAAANRPAPTPPSGVPVRSLSPYWAALVAMVLASALAVGLGTGAITSPIGGASSAAALASSAPKPVSSVGKTGEPVPDVSASSTPAAAEGSVQLVLRSVELSRREQLELFGLLALPLSFGVLVTFVARRRRLFPAFGGPYWFELSYPELPPPIPDSSMLEDLAMLLDRSSPKHQTGELEPFGTVTATANAGGIPKLVWAARKAKRRHLVLMSADTRLSAPRRHLDALLDALATLGVALERFEVVGGTEVFPRQAPDVRISLESLAGQFDTLIVFADPELSLESAEDDATDATHPATLATWTRDLNGFGARLWLCASRGHTATRGAAALLSSGWQVEPLELDALERLVQQESVAQRQERFDAASQGAARARDAVSFYANHLGPAFPLLCASTALPSLSDPGLRFLVGRFGAGLSWDSLARLLGIPWLLDGTWPDGLDTGLRRELWDRHPDLAGQVHDAIEALLSAQQPAVGSGAAVVHAVTSLEQSLKRGGLAERNFQALTAGPEYGRERLRRSPLVREWAQRRRLRGLRLWTARSPLVVAALAGALLLVTGIAGRWVEQALEKRAVDTLAPELEQLSAPIEDRIESAFNQCWSDGATNAGQVLSRAGTETVRVPFQVQVDPSGAISVTSLNSSPRLKDCTRRLERWSMDRWAGRSLAFAATAVLPQWVSPIEAAPAPTPVVSPESPDPFVGLGSASSAAESHIGTVASAKPVTKPAATSSCTLCAQLASGGVSQFSRAANAFEKCSDEAQRVQCVEAAGPKFRAWLDGLSSQPTDAQCKGALSIVSAARVLRAASDGDQQILLKICPNAFGLTTQAPPPKDNTAQAKAAFQRGAAAYAEGDYPNALAEFKKSYALEPHPALLFKVGNTEKAMGNRAGALATFRELTTRYPQADEAKRAAEEIQKLEGAGAKPAPVRVEAPPAPSDEAAAAEATPSPAGD